MTRFLTTMLALLSTAPMVSASYCYAPSYSYGRSYYQPSYGHDYYQYPFFTKFAAVIPLVELPTYSTTLGPATITATTTTTQTSATASAGTPATTAVATGTGTAAGVAELKEILLVVKGIASKQDNHEQRLRALELRVSPPPLPTPTPTPAREPAPVPPMAPAAKADTLPVLPAALAVYKQSCASCHQSGSESKGGGFALLTAAGERGPITAKQMQALAKHVTRGTMPPRGYPALSNEAATAILDDLANFALKKE